MRYRLILVLFLFLFAGCTAATPVTAPTPTPMVFQPMLGRALSFLARQYDAGPGLLHTSPQKTDAYWLIPDNLLVERVLQEANAAELSVDIETRLEDYGTLKNGLVEILNGDAVEWPPKLAVQTEVSPTVWLESYTGDGTIDGWAARADLGFWGTMNAWNQKDAARARTLFADAMRLFDGTGFPDPTPSGNYATADLALALLAAQRIGEPVNDTIVRQLLALQGADGGFAAHYSAAGPVDGPDTLTTAYALLSLYALRQPVD